MNAKNILETLVYIDYMKQYAEVLETLGYRPLAVFLNGSQNYGMETEKSDIDAYAVVIPDKVSFLFSRPANTTITMDNGQVKVKDIRIFVSELLKGNYSTLELLVTPYRYTSNAEFDRLFTEFAQTLLAESRQKTVASTLGSASCMKEIVKRNTDKENRIKNLARIRHLHRLTATLMDETVMGNPKYSETEKFTFALYGTYAYGEPVEDMVQREAVAIKSLDADKITDTVLGQMIDTMTERDEKIREKYQTWSKNKPAPKPDMELRNQLADWVTGIFLNHMEG